MQRVLADVNLNGLGLVWCLASALTGQGTNYYIGGHLNDALGQHIKFYVCVPLCLVCVFSLCVCVCVCARAPMYAFNIYD